MKIKIVNIEKTRRSGTQVGQNETRLTPREASKSESQKRSEIMYTPQKLPASSLKIIKYYNVSLDADMMHRELQKLIKRDEAYQTFFLTE